MYYHYIFMFSDYEFGTRKAYYKTFLDVKKIKEFRNDIKQIKGDFKNIAFSLHQVMTDSDEISSVVEYDKYFKDVVFYSDKHKFENELQASTKITSSDILKYVLIKKQCTKLKALKLVYLIYERYLRETGEFLFEEDFLAWKLGPVVKSAYLKLSPYKYNEIKLEDIVLEKAKLTLKFDRVQNKEKIVECVDYIIENYGHWQTEKLVNLTHEEERPWYKVKENLGLGNSITKEYMLDYVFN